MLLLLLCRCQLRHIHHESIIIATYIIGGRWWHGIWHIRWIPTRYWRSLRLMRCVLWRDGWVLTNRGQLRWINYWIVQCRRHRYHQWWQLIALWVTILANKSPVITRIFLWKSVWMLMKRGKLSLINEWIIQWRRHRYHRWWKLIDI